LDGLRFHDLRHHAITRMAEAGVADQTQMALAGHVSSAMLEHYSHVRTEAKQAAVAAISTALPADAEAGTPSAIQYGRMATRVENRVEVAQSATGCRP
jgi:hypothetical protein